jgi:hypothetical protein
VQLSPSSRGVSRRPCRARRLSLRHSHACAAAACAVLHDWIEERTQQYLKLGLHLGQPSLVARVDAYRRPRPSAWGVAGVAPSCCGCPARAKSAAHGSISVSFIVTSRCERSGVPCNVRSPLGRPRTAMGKAKVRRLHHRRMSWACVPTTAACQHMCGAVLSGLKCLQLSTPTYTQSSRCCLDVPTLTARQAHSG